MVSTVADQNAKHDCLKLPRQPHNNNSTFFYLSIFILVINQLDAQYLFYSKFISYLYMFRAPCAQNM